MSTPVTQLFTRYQGSKRIEDVEIMEIPAEECLAYRALFPSAGDLGLLHAWRYAQKTMLQETSDEWTRGRHLELARLLLGRIQTMRPHASGINALNGSLFNDVLGTHFNPEIGLALLEKARTSTEYDELEVAYENLRAGSASFHAGDERWSSGRALFVSAYVDFLRHPEVRRTTLSVADVGQYVDEYWPLVWRSLNGDPEALRDSPQFVRGFAATLGEKAAK